MHLKGAGRWLVLWTVAVATTARPVRAESGSAGWLRYERIADAAAALRYRGVSGSILTLGDSLVVRTAGDELAHGIESMLGRRLTVERAPSAAVGIVLGTPELIVRAFRGVQLPDLARADAFWIGTATAGRR